MWDKEVEVDKEDKLHEEAEHVEAEDATNARRSQTTCAIKSRAEVDKEDVATTVVSQSHQEVRDVASTVLSPLHQEVRIR